MRTTAITVPIFIPASERCLSQHEQALQKATALSPRAARFHYWPQVFWAFYVNPVNQVYMRS
jgi:hypothetical protein